jgi:HEAT repeat protein
VNPQVLACLAATGDPALLGPYLDRIVLDDPDALKAQRHRRGAIALLVALGEPAIDTLCLGLEHPRPEVRSLVARALAESNSPRARTCLGAGALNPLPGARLAVAEALPVSLARGQIDPGPGWEMTLRLLGDPEAAVRIKATSYLNIFNPALAMPVAERMTRDGDPAVAAAGQRAVAEVQMTLKHEQLMGR